MASTLGPLRSVGLVLLAVAALAVLAVPSHAWTGGDASYDARDNKPAGTEGRVLNKYAAYQGSTGLTCPAAVNADDAISGDVKPAALSFDSYGTAIARIIMDSNGYVSFNALTTFDSTPTTIPNTATPNNIIAGFWGDLDPDGAGTGRVCHRLAGTGSEQDFLMLYDNVAHFGSTTQRANFAIVLFEYGNAVEVHYAASTGRAATQYIGMENTGGTTGFTYASGASLTRSDEAVQYRPKTSFPDAKADGDVDLDGDVDVAAYKLDQSLTPGLDSLTIAAADAVLLNDMQIGNVPLRACQTGAAGIGACPDVGSTTTITTVGGGTVKLDGDGTFVYTPKDQFYCGLDSFEYDARDDWPMSTTRNRAKVTIEITGCNGAPVAADDAYSVYQGLTLVVDAATGLLANDADTDVPPDLPLETLATCVVYSGASSLAVALDGGFSYTPPPSFYGTDTFTYCAKDAYGSTSEQATVTITVIPNDKPHPAYYISDTSPDAGKAVSFTDDSSDRDGLRSWLWDFGDARTSTARNPTHVWTFPGDYIVSLTACDIYGACATHTRVLTVGFPPEGSPQASAGGVAPPVAKAGLDRVAASGAIVHLVGGHEGEPGTYTYQWSQVGEPKVQLRNETKATADFVAPTLRDEDIRLVFQLIVANQDASSRPDQVEVLVRAANRAPIASAGMPIQATPGQAVKLDASASRDDDGDALTYRWSQVSGPRVALSAFDTVDPSFTVPADATPGTMLFRVEATDGAATGADSVQVIIVPEGRGSTATVTTPAASTSATATQAAPAAGLLVAALALGLAGVRRRLA